MLRTTLLLLCAAPGGGTGDVALFLDPGTGTGLVLTVTPGGAPVDLPLDLVGTRLLDVDFAGRTPLLELLPDRPRRMADVGPGAARIALPGGHGSLYRFRRAASFGFFVVGPDGRARVVLEAPAAGGLDPFLPVVAVSPDGGALLVATTPGAGGDLYEVLLATGEARLRTAAAPPLAFAPGGLALLERFGLAAAGAQLWRFDRLDPAAGAAPVDFGPVPPAVVTGALAASADGRVAACVAGAGATALDVWAVEADGPAERLSAQPGAVVGADAFGLDGPFLALSTDGSWCTWMTQEPAEPGVTTREAWSARRGAAPAPAAALTADPTVVDTLDQPGDFVYLSPTSLLLIVGEVADALGGIDDGELLRVEHHAGAAPTFVNLSLTSGDPTPPFPPGELKTEDGVHLLPDLGHVIVLRRDSGDGDLVAASTAAPGLVTLIPAVDSILWARATADARLVVAVRRDDGAEPAEVWEGPLDLSQPLKKLLTAPGTAALGVPALGPGGWVAVREGTLGADRLHRLHPASGAVQTLPFAPLEIGPGLAFAGGGVLSFTAGPPGGATGWFAGWPLTATAGALHMGGFEGRVLPDGP